MDQSNQNEQLIMFNRSETLNITENSEQHGRHQDRVKQMPDQAERRVFLLRQERSPGSLVKHVNEMTPTHIDNFIDSTEEINR